MSSNYSYINKSKQNQTPFFQVYSDNWPYRTPDQTAGHESYTAAGDIDIDSLMDTLEARNDIRRNENKLDPVKAKPGTADPVKSPDPVKADTVKSPDPVKPDHGTADAVKSKVKGPEPSFWFHDPSILINNFDIVPDQNMELNRYLNTLARLSIIAFLILWYFKKDTKFIWIPIIVLIMTIYFHTFKIRNLDGFTKSILSENFTGTGSSIQTSTPKNIDPAVNKSLATESVNNSNNYSLLTDVRSDYTTFTPKLSDKPGDYKWVNAFDHEPVFRTKYSDNNQNFNFELYADLPEKHAAFMAERLKEKLVPFERSLDNFAPMWWSNKNIDRKLYYNDR
jgi:hypothetical protein